MTPTSPQAIAAIARRTASASRGAAREGRMAQYLTTGAAYKLGVGREIAREVVTPRLRLGLPTGGARCLVSDLTCGRCSKVNLAGLLQDPAREDQKSVLEG